MPGAHVAKGGETTPRLLTTPHLLSLFWRLLMLMYAYISINQKLQYPYSRQRSYVVYLRCK